MMLIRSSWRFFIRHPWQLWLTLLSIALGTAVIIAVDLANQTAKQSFQQSVNVLSGAMTHEITAVRGRIPDDFYRQLRVAWGYRDAAPLLEKPLDIAGLQYTLIGIDPFAAPLAQFTDMTLEGDAITRLMTESGAVVASNRSGWQPGQTLTADGQVFEVIALAEIAAELLIGDIATAQGDAPGLDKIQLKLTAPEAEALQARLPSSLQLESFQERQQVFTQMTQAFSTNLMALSLLAMLVGAFLVYNTMTFSVLQRRRSFAIGRMVGVTGRQLFRHLLLEALVLGVIGSTLGVLLGVLLGQGLLVLVTQTINDLYVSVQADALLLTPLLVLKGVGITLLAVLVATLAPALEAARVSPVQVARQSALEQGSQRLGARLAMGGVALMSLSWALLAGFGSSLLLGFVGLFLLILGYSLCVPLVLRLGLQAMQRLPGLQASLLIRMVVRGVQASLSRTALAIIALTVAVSATVGVSIMIGSFRASVADWLSMTLSSDLYVSATNVDGSRVNGALSPGWLERIQALPEVASVSTGLTARLPVDGVEIPLLVMQPAVHSGAGFEFLQGGDTAWEGFVAGEGLVVSEPFAYHNSKQVGDTVRLQTALAGEVALPVLGIFRDYSATQGMVVLPRSLYERYWADRSISSVGMRLAAGADVQAVRERLTGWAAELQQPGQPLVVRSNRDIREVSLQVFDRTFAVTNVLRLLVIIVAFVGVFSALMALFLEKGREYAILRATGVTPGQLQRLVMGQAALIGILAGLLSLPLGGLMSAVLIDIINQRSFGWTMQTHFFPLVGVQALLLALAAAWLASLYPVRRISAASIRAGLG